MPAFPGRLRRLTKPAICTKFLKSPGWLLLLLVCLALFAASCQLPVRPGALPTPTGPPPLAPLLGEPSPSPVVAVSAEETPEALASSTSAPASALAPTETIDPLRFTFPTALVEPSSLWRPPLYPVPWEPTPHDHFFFARPIGANEVNWPLANYRYGGVFFENTVHTGIDIPSPIGTAILAAGPGEVIWAGYGLYLKREDFDDPYGMAVAIKHTFGYEGQSLYTIYGHMDELKAWRGQKVQTGDLLGTVGITGKTTGPHLHFEVRIGDNEYSRSRNPELWIAPPQGWGVLAARVMNDGGLWKRATVNLRHLASNRYWYVITYGEGSTNSDTYYQENMVIGDLPAGKYMIWISYQNRIYDQVIEIQPGMVSYFTFRGSRGFDLDLPPVPGPVFPTPQVITSTLPLTSPLSAAP